MSLSTLAVVLAMIGVYLAQQPASVWDAVYSAAQAERGKLVYEARCIRCHASDLQGVRGAALGGGGFIRNWEARSVGRLFRMIRNTMPPDRTAALTEGEQIDTVAFLLQQNGFPAGATELSPDPAVLADIQIKSRTPSPLRTGALVQVSGCLTPDADGWLLTNGTDLEMTSLEDHPSNRASLPRKRGDRVVRLMNVFPNPAPHRGHTVLAKGFLVRDSAGDRVNVATLEMIDSRCER